MRILPVLDLLNGQVVRGIAGRRDEYRPIRSRLIEGSEPVAIAEAIRLQFGLTGLYLADLDAILHRRANVSVLRSLSDAGFTTMVDAGLRRPEDAAPIFAAGAQQVVAGLETLAGPEALASLVREWGAGRVVFSLDLRDGRPLGERTAWSDSEPFDIARKAVEAGCIEMIVLDLARVGTAEGISTLSLCARIRGAFPNVAIVTGGGVRGVADLRRLEESGVSGVLIASALHDGSIGPLELAKASGSE